MSNIQVHEIDSTTYPHKPQRSPSPSAWSVETIPLHHDGNYPEPDSTWSPRSSTSENIEVLREYIPYNVFGDIEDGFFDLGVAENGDGEAYEEIEHVVGEYPENDGMEADWP
ncbi:hypothetical protein NQ315_009037 [Exocentrus adspersus]|uniref:Uncharacterized protein n=1 Tax=Exocentrus adspersus TaxID=1586481 RepID=A0AAV8VDK3_9CUCU|nr:hypothetical protein NQ315_009037 [Exocentrus adspersus]